jgi:hypothetical protein
MHLFVFSNLILIFNQRFLEGIQSVAIVFPTPVSMTHEQQPSVQLLLRAFCYEARELAREAAE